MNRLLASSLILALLVGASCTSNDSEQQEAIEHNKRIEAQEAQDKADAEAKAKADASSQTQVPLAPQAEATQTPSPEQAPAEPEVKTVTMYHFTSNSEHGAITCNDEGTVQPCGVMFTNCAGDSEYACQTGVHAWTTQDTVTNSE